MSDAKNPPPDQRKADADIYERLAPELIRFATGLVGPSDAEDLLATSVIKALSARAWPGIENKRAYLYRVLTNEASKSRRSAVRRQHREIGASERQPAAAVVWGNDPDVFAALRRLRARQRAVIHLTYWADQSPQQIAETLDTSLRTVERELTNARSRLEQLLS